MKGCGGCDCAKRVVKSRVQATCFADWLVWRLPMRGLAAAVVSGKTEAATDAVMHGQKDWKTWNHFFLVVYFFFS